MGVFLTKMRFLRLNVQKSRQFPESQLFPTKETLPMKKLTFHYIRYALALLANVGFKLSSN